jgi:hypothetical protein
MGEKSNLDLENKDGDDYNNNKMSVYQQKVIIQ